MSGVEVKTVSLESPAGRTVAFLNMGTAVDAAKVLTVSVCVCVGVCVCVCVCVLLLLLLLL